MSELKLTDREWKGFRVEDLFYFENKPSKGLNHLKQCDDGVNYVGATNRNNGVLAYVEANQKAIYKGNAIAFIRNGEGSMGYSVYKAEDFVATQDISVGYNENLNRYIGLFIVAVADKVRGKYNFGYKRNQKRLNKETLHLPINSDGLPDWQFMEDFIKQKEQKQIADLKDYYADKAVELIISTGSLKNTEWQEFSFSDIFIEVKRGKRLTKGNQQSGETPYVSSTAANNGVDNFIGNSKGVRTFENCLTLANSGSVGSTFFHHYTFVASDHVTALILEKPNKYIYLFLSGIIRRLEEKYSFNREINDKRIQREKILLPVNSDGLPDWQFMEDFMKQIERDKIAAVLSYYNNSLNNNSLRGGVERWMPSENRWAAFAIQDICEIHSGVRLTKQDMQEGKMPFIGSSDSNNGITAFIANKNASLDKDVLGVNYNGSVVENFYHPYECLFSDDVKRLKIKSKHAGKYAYLFLKTMILKQKSKYRYGYKFNATRMAKQKILLPVDASNQPDWINIERFMQQMELEKIICYLKSKSQP